MKEALDWSYLPTAGHTTQNVFNYSIVDIGEEKKEPESDSMTFWLLILCTQTQILGHSSAPEQSREPTVSTLQERTIETKERNIHPTKAKLGISTYKHLNRHVSKCLDTSKKHKHEQRQYASKDTLTIAALWCNTAEPQDKHQSWTCSRTFKRIWINPLLKSVRTQTME